jgi:FKBP-type peptidyl-prolyl cis-trans isomerases 1
MIRRLLTFFSFCVVLSSCKKDDPNACTFTESGVVVPASEMTSLQAYIAANHPTATLHAGGFYYEINAAGTGTVTPGICSNVTVKYAGYLTNGFKFTSAAEENTVTTYALGQLIVGWQRGLPLIKAGGTIKLYLPPSLGYGNNAVGSIPPNSILIFVIQLTAVQ